MTDYETPPPEVAEFVYQKNLECEVQRQRLKGASADDAWEVARDPSESDAARLEAILILALNRDLRFPTWCYPFSTSLILASGVRSFAPSTPMTLESGIASANSPIRPTTRDPQQKHCVYLCKCGTRIPCRFVSNGSTAAKVKETLPWKHYASWEQILLLSCSKPAGVKRKSPKKTGTPLPLR